MTIEGLDQVLTVACASTARPLIVIVVFGVVSAGVFSRDFIVAINRKMQRRIAEVTRVWVGAGSQRRFRRSHDGKVSRICSAARSPEPRAACTVPQ